MIVYRPHAYVGILFFFSPEDFELCAVESLTGKCQNLRPSKTQVPTDFLYPDLSQDLLFPIWAGVLELRTGQRSLGSLMST